MPTGGLHASFVLQQRCNSCCNRSFSLIQHSFGAAITHTRSPAAIAAAVTGDDEDSEYKLTVTNQQLCAWNNTRFQVHYGGGGLAATDFARMERQGGVSESCRRLIRELAHAGAAGSGVYTRGWAEVPAASPAGARAGTHAHVMPLGAHARSLEQRGKSMDVKLLACVAITRMCSDRMVVKPMIACAPPPSPLPMHQF